ASAPIRAQRMPRSSSTRPSASRALRSTSSDVPPALEHSPVCFELGIILAFHTGLRSVSESPAYRFEPIEHLVQRARRSLVRKRTIRTRDALEVRAFGAGGASRSHPLNVPRERRARRVRSAEDLRV